MNNLIAYRNPDIWKNTLSFMIAITFMIVWLPFIRSLFDGETYEWGTNYFGYYIGGKGVTASFIYLIIQMAFYIILMKSIYWIQNRNIFYALISLWFVNSFGNILFEVYQDGDAMFHGDTMNVHISILWIVIPLSALALALIIATIISDKNRTEVNIPWNYKNKVLAYIIFGFIPIQYLLLAFGETHGISDKIGVIISISQCYALPFMYKPWQSK
ncbi:MAG: ubiquinol cytochrome C oxidoreductase [Reichenbachiella sp.]